MLHPTAMCTLRSLELLELITLLSLITGAILQVTGKRALRKTMISGLGIRQKGQLES